MKSILDPSFKYVPAAATDVAKTFERARQEQAAAKLRGQQQAAPLPTILFAVPESTDEESDAAWRAEARLRLMEGGF